MGSAIDTTLQYAVDVQENHASKAPFFSKKCSPEEYPFFLDLYCHSSQRRFGFLGASCVVVRTDSWPHLCEDLFFPSLCHTMPTLGKKVRPLALIPLVCWDLASLIVRMASLWPRYRYNRTHAKEAHPLYRWLIEQGGVDARTLAPDHVYLILRTMKMGKNPETSTIQEMQEEIRGKTIALRQLPKRLSPHETHWEISDLCNSSLPCGE
jgi:hypothetical protein